MKVRSPKLLAFYRVASRCADIFLKKQITRSAAALSFFLTMSIFPFLICLNWMVGTLRVDVTEIASFFGGFIPKETLSVINDYLAYIENSQSLPMLIGGLVLMATTSSSAFRTIRTAMDDIYARSRPRPLWTWVFSFLASFVFLLSVYFCILILLTGGWFLKLLTQHFGIAPLIDHWSWIRFLVLFLFVLLMVYGLNRVAAPRGREEPRISVIGGALLTAFALVVVSILFSFFIGLSARYSLVYGSLASVIILMVWLYACCNILFIGSILNAVLFQRHHPRRRRKKKAFPAAYTEEEGESLPLPPKG